MEKYLPRYRVDYHIATFKQCFQEQYAVEEVPANPRTIIGGIESQEGQGSNSFLSGFHSYNEDVNYHEDKVTKYLSSRSKKVVKPLE